MLAMDMLSKPSPALLGVWCISADQTIATSAEAVSIVREEGKVCSKLIWWCVCPPIMQHYVVRSCALHCCAPSAGAVRGVRCRQRLESPKARNGGTCACTMKLISTYAGLGWMSARCGPVPCCGHISQNRVNLYAMPHKNTVPSIQTDINF